METPLTQYDNDVVEIMNLLEKFIREREEHGINLKFRIENKFCLGSNWTNKIADAARDDYIEIGGDPVPLREVKYIDVRKDPDFQSCDDETVKMAEVIFDNLDNCRYFFNIYENMISIVVSG